jgi:HlyD family secretion protein
MHRKKFPRWIIPAAIIAACLGSLFYFRANPVVVKAAAPDLARVATTHVLTGTIETSVDTTGTVRTNKSETVSWNASGQVSEVLVQIGDQVKKGQVLAQLDPASNPEWASEAANLLVAQENLANLQKTAASIASAKITLINAQAAVDSAQKALDDLNITVTQADIDAANATYLQAQKTAYQMQVAYNVAVATADELTVVKARQALDTATLAENSAYARLNNLLNYQPNSNELSTANSNLALAKARLAVAQAAYDAVKNGPSQVDLDNAQVQIDSIEASLEVETLTAPMDGTITAVDVSVNDLVSNGTEAFQIDDMSSLYIDVSISETDIDNIYVGQEMNLSLDAVTGKQYTAQVTAISSSSTYAGGGANYPVTAVLIDADSAIMPGMTADASVITAQHSNVLLVPNLSVTTQNGNKVVDLIRDNAVISVPVTIGLVSDTQSEISSPQIKSDDVIVLNPARLNAESSSSGLFAKIGELLQVMGVTVAG